MALSKVVFPTPLRPVTTDALPILKREIESAKQQRAVAQRDAEIAQFHDAISQRWRRWDAQFYFLLDRRSFLRGSFVVTLEAVLLFAALRARAHADPREFLFQKHLPLVLHRRVCFLALGLGQQVIGVIRRHARRSGHRPVRRCG